MRRAIIVQESQLLPFDKAKAQFHSASAGAVLCIPLKWSKAKAHPEPDKKPSAVKK